MANKDKGYIIPHTHWDREWRYPIWKNRVLLIEFMDKLLNILDQDPEYHCFLLDGQVAPIEDYLEVMPHQENRVKKHIQDGRIAIGPWYTLPDLYPIDGECLVRNLLKGTRLCKKYGDYLKVGYNSFGWGQTAQFPQIYNDFGFDFIICAKKVSEERAPESEFMWESPDGTRVLTSRLGDFARANFFFNAYIDTRYGVKFLSDEFEYKPHMSGMAIHNTSCEVAHEDYFLIKPKEAYYKERLKEGVDKAWQGTDETVLKSHRLFMNGCDFSTPQPDLTKIINDVNLLYKDKEFVNARLEEYTQDLYRLVDKSELKVVKGELRDGPSCDCSGNALATRIYIKQLNKKAQNILMKKAEPFSSIAGIMTNVYPKSFLELGWRYMLDSHPHDSINGVTQDKTADDVEFRLKQAIEIGEVLYDEAINTIVKQINYGPYNQEDMLFVVFNTMAYETSDILKVCLDTPKDQAIWSFDIEDCKGNKVEVHQVGIEEKNGPVHDLEGRPWPIYVDRHTCYIETGNIPAMGYKVFQIIPKKYFNRKHHYWVDMRKTTGNEICKCDNVLENKYLKVSINPNGTFELLDKENNKEYKGLHYFEDTGDVGNYWAYYPPYNNKIFNTLTSAPKIWLADNCDLSATVYIEYTLDLPKRGHEPIYGVQGKSDRSEEGKELKILTEITLKKNSKKVDIKTKLNNTIENHRLRVAFPTDIKSDYSHAAGHFTVDKRPVISTRDQDGKYYNEMQTLPMQNFVDINNGTYGMAFLNNCLTEFEVKDDERNTVYLTLFRSMNNMIVTGWECVGVFPNQKGSQLLREMEFEYSIYPHEAGWENGEVYYEAQKLNTPLASYQLMGAEGGELPLENSFMSLSNKNVVISAFKKCEDREGYILRLFNPTSEDQSVIITLPPRVKTAYLTNLNEVRQQQVDQDSKGCIILKIKQNKIITLELEV